MMEYFLSSDASFHHNYLDGNSCQSKVELQSICDFMCTFISVLFLFFFHQVSCRKNIALKNRVFTAQNQYVHKKGHFFHAFGFIF